MDNYDRYENDLNEQHDYNLCMAKCPDYKTANECGCNGGELQPLQALAVLSPFITIIIAIIVARLIKAIRENKDKKEYKEYERRKRIGDTKWVKDYEQRRTQAFYKNTKKQEKK